MSFVNEAIEFLTQEYQDGYQFLFTTETNGDIELTITLSSIHQHILRKDVCKFIRRLWVLKDVGEIKPFKWQDALVEYIEDGLHT